MTRSSCLAQLPAQLHERLTLWRGTKYVKVGREKQELLGTGLPLTGDHRQPKDRASIPWMLFLPAKGLMIFP